MHQRSFAWTLLIAGAGSALAAGLPSCSSSGKTPVGLAQGCSLNSDCDNPLVCVFSLCHEQCVSSRDCSPGQTCVTSGKGSVCQLQSESSCAGDSAACQAPLTCGPSGQCLNACGTGTSTCDNGNICISGQCHTPVAPDGGLIEASPPDGATGGDGGPSGDGAPGSDGSDGSDGSMSDGTLGDDGGEGSVGDENIVDVHVEGSQDAHEAGPPIDAGPLGYIPSNFDPNMLTIVDGGLPDGGNITFANAPDVTVSATCGFNLNPCDPYWKTPYIIPLPKTSPTQYAYLYIAHNLWVQSAIRINFGPSPYATIIAVTGTAEIDGTLDVSATQNRAGPGGWDWYAGTSNGPGGGGLGFSASFPTSYAGGASFCGLGGHGAASSGSRTPPGGIYGTPELIPLLAGSSGGYYGGDWWGAGGGAVQISAATSIMVAANGVINAGGGGGYGGGGSGGGILLEAPVVTVQGFLIANGGGGGTEGNPGGNAIPNDTPAPGYLTGGPGSYDKNVDGRDGTTGDAGNGTLGAGGGGAGRIRLNTASGKAVVTGATISPSLQVAADAGKGASACATEGTLVY